MFYAFLYPTYKAFCFENWDDRPYQKDIIYLKEDNIKDDYTCSYQSINELGEPNKFIRNNIEACDINSSRLTAADKKYYRGITYKLRDINTGANRIFFFHDLIDDLTEFHTCFMESIISKMRNLNSLNRFDAMRYKEDYERERKHNAKLLAQVNSLRDRLEELGHKNEL